jgi:hypothetical protein
MKKHLIRIAVLFFFVWTSWACGIADAFVADEIDSIKDPEERARAWQVEYFYQEHGRYPTDEERAELFGEKETNEAPAKKEKEAAPVREVPPPLPPPPPPSSNDPADFVPPTMEGDQGNPGDSVRGE